MDEEIEYKYNTSKYNTLKRDEKGFYFSHPNGGKIRGKSMLKKFARLTQCPEGVDMCIDKKGDIGIFAPKELKEGDKWDQFVNLLQMASTIEERHDTIQEACNGTHVKIQKKNKFQ